MGDRESQAIIVIIIIIAFLATRTIHYREPHVAWILAYTHMSCLPPRKGELSAADWRDTRSAKTKTKARRHKTALDTTCTNGFQALWIRTKPSSSSRGSIVAADHSGRGKRKIEKKSRTLSHSSMSQLHSSHPPPISTIHFSCLLFSSVRLPSRCLQRTHTKRRGRCHRFRHPKRSLAAASRCLVQGSMRDPIEMRSSLRSVHYTYSALVDDGE